MKDVYVLTAYSDSSNIGIIFNKGTGPTVYEAVVDSLMGDLITDRDEFIDELLEDTVELDMPNYPEQALKNKLREEQEAVVGWLVLPSLEIFDSFNM